LPPERRGFGMVFQNYALFPHLTVFDNVAFGLALRRRPRTEIAQRVRRMLELVQLAEYEARYPGQLSGGQQQRVAIARALAVEPKVLLADEPISMLDVSIRIGILNLILELKQRHEIAFLYITHDIASARYVADEVLVMYAGRIVEQGPTDDVLQTPLHEYTQLLLSAVPNPEAGLHRQSFVKARRPSTDGELVEARPGHFV